MPPLNQPINSYYSICTRATYGDYENHSYSKIPEPGDTGKPFYKESYGQPLSWEEEIYQLKRNLNLANFSIEQAHERILELEKTIDKQTQVYRLKVEHMQDLVNQFEAIFNKSGAQIVFDNGRLEEPLRLIQRDL